MTKCSSSTTIRSSARRSSRPPEARVRRRVVTRAEEAFERLLAEDFDVVLTDLKMPGVDGIALCERIVANRPDIPVVVMTAFGSLDSAVAAIRAGAYDFIDKPVQIDVARHRDRPCGKDARAREEVPAPRDRRDFGAADDLIGRSEAMREVTTSSNASPIRRPRFLVTGESGTGKEVVARRNPPSQPPGARARSSPSTAPRCPRRCSRGALRPRPRRLYRRARGARRTLRPGRGGTLLPRRGRRHAARTSAEVLRVLQERKVRPLGSTTEVAVDVRVIAATNRDLEDAVEEGRFRENLYFRLNVINIALPPLRRARATCSRSRNTARHLRRAQRQGQSRASRPLPPRSSSRYSWPATCANCRTASSGRSRSPASTDLRRGSPEKLRE